MITRVRIEAEGSSIQEVERALQTAFDSLVVESNGKKALEVMFGTPNERNAYPGLVEAQAGEFVIERFARDDDEIPGAIVYRGRQVSHYAKPVKVRKLNPRSDVDPYVA